MVVQLQIKIIIFCKILVRHPIIFLVLQAKDRDLSMQLNPQWE